MAQKPSHKYNAEGIQKASPATPSTLLLPDLSQKCPQRPLCPPSSHVVKITVASSHHSPEMSCRARQGRQDGVNLPGLGTRSLRVPDGRTCCFALSHDIKRVTGKKCKLQFYGSLWKNARPRPLVTFLESPRWRAPTMGPRKVENKMVAVTLPCVKSTI